MSPNKRNRKTKKTFDYEGEDTGYTRALEDARQSFRIGTYFPIIDLKLQKLEDENLCTAYGNRILIFC